MTTDDKSRISRMSRDVGVVSFDASQLDCAQPYHKGGAYKDSAGPLHKIIDAGFHRTELRNIQETPNQYWNRENSSGMYQARANMESYGNHHSYTPPNFGASNEVNSYSPHWRRKLSKGFTSFPSTEQLHYHGGYQVHSEAHQNYHQYQSCGPKYHSTYHPHPIISTRNQAQHHPPHSASYHQDPPHSASYHQDPPHSASYHQAPHYAVTNQESNGAFMRTGNIAPSDREIEQIIYPLTPPHHPLPTQSLNRTYSQPPPNALAMNYNNSNAEYYPKLSEDQFRSNHSLTGIYDSASRKRKHEDASCAQVDSTEYTIYTDRCMSPVSDMSVSSAASEQEDLFCQTPNNNPIMHQPLSEPMIDERPDILARRNNNVIEKVPSKSENQVPLEVPRIERGETDYSYFNFEKNIMPARTVTPMRMKTHNLQEGRRDEYHEYEL